MKSKKIASLNDLFIEELGDLYSAETQLIQALPKMVQATTAPELKTALKEHLEKTKEHVKRLEEVFAELDEEIPQMKCKGMEGLIEEGKEMIEESEKSPARDAALIGAAQRVEHYEIAGYGTASSHASLLGFDHIQTLLDETLEEEKEADEQLSEIAEEFVNAEANQSM